MNDVKVATKTTKTRNIAKNFIFSVLNLFRKESSKSISKLEDELASDGHLILLGSFYIAVTTDGQCDSIIRMRIKKRERERERENE